MHIIRLRQEANGFDRLAQARNVRDLRAAIRALGDSTAPFTVAYNRGTRARNATFHARRADMRTFSECLDCGGTGGFGTTGDRECPTCTGTGVC